VKRRVLTARFSQLILYALKSRLPGSSCSGAPVGPAPISAAARDGATVKTALSASSIPVITYLSSHTVTRFFELESDSCPYSRTKQRILVDEETTPTRRTNGPTRVTLIVSWYSPAAMRMIAEVSSGLFTVNVTFVKTIEYLTATR